ncbi:MAG: aspartate/glutamate racemase family protein [Rubrivivax sp.]
MRLLLLNPNTTQAITARMARAARRVLLPGETLHELTATQGPAVVRSATQLAEAEAQALALARQHGLAYDVIVLAISLDGAAPALREACPDAVVVGMTEAALEWACAVAAPAGLLTVGSAMLPLYQRRVAECGCADAVVAFAAPDIAAAFDVDVSTVQPAVLAALAAAAEGLRAQGARSVVLAGAVLCGYAPALQASIGLPVFDGIECAVRVARERRRQRATITRGSGGVA